MKILLIGNLPEDHQESMRRFTTLLQTGLTGRGHSVSTITPTLVIGRLAPRYEYNGIPKFLGYFDKFVVFPWILRRRIKRDRPDIIHITDQAGAVYISSTCGVPVVTTCHDLLQIRAAYGELHEHRLGKLGRRFQEWIAACITRADNVVCVSSHTKNELLRLLGTPSGHFDVVLNSLNYPYRKIAPDLARSRLNSLARRLNFKPDLINADGPGFVLQIGGLQWYKNRLGVIEIFARMRNGIDPPPNLVMVGPPLEPEHLLRVGALGLTNNVVVIAPIENDELEALYNLAACLLFPSWEEGFGWPIAEAQACGCPVFASDRAPMTEVGAEYCGYFDPSDSTAAAQTIVSKWSDRKRLSEGALNDAKRWEPAQMLSSYEAVYERISL